MAVATAGPQLPVDGSGKVTGSFQFSSGPVIHLPAGVVVDPISGVGAQVSAAGEQYVAFIEPSDTTATVSNATTLNTAWTIATTGLNTVTVSLRADGGTFTAFPGFVFQVSDDGGTNWYSILATEVALTDTGNIGTLTGAGNGMRQIGANQATVLKIDVSGFTHFRVILRQVMTGTGTVAVRIGATAANSTKPSTNSIVGSTGGSSVSVTQVNADGIDFQFNIALDVVAFNYLFDPVAGTWSRQRAKVLPAGAEGLPAMPVWMNAIQLLTYDVAARNIASGALTANTAKAMLSIEHSAASTKTVKLRRITVHASQTTALAGPFDIQITKGTAASSAGTAITPAPRRVGDTAAECVVKSLPTITAASVGDSIPAGGFGATTALYSPPMVVYDYQEGGETKPYILRVGVLESIVINAISTVAHNLTMTISVDLTEE